MGKLTGCRVARWAIVTAAAVLALLRTAPLAAGIPAGVKVALLDVAAAAERQSDGVELLALRRIFSTLGVTCDVLSRAGTLDAYRVIFTAGALPNSPLASLANDLYDYVEGGGVLVSSGEVGSNVYPLFGVEKRVPSRRRFRLSFAGKDPSLSYLTHPRMLNISLGNGEPPFYDEVVWSHGASLTAHATVGFSVHPYGRGKASLLGLSYTEAVLLPQVGGSYNAERQYANGIEPSADSIMLLLKAI